MLIDLSNVQFNDPEQIKISPTETLTATAPVSVNEHLEMIGWWDQILQKDFMQQDIAIVAMRHREELNAICYEGLAKLKFSEADAKRVMTIFGPLIVIAMVINGFFNGRAKATKERLANES